MQSIYHLHQKLTRTELKHGAYKDKQDNKGRDTIYMYTNEERENQNRTEPIEQRQGEHRHMLRQNESLIHFNFAIAQYFV